MLAFLQIQKLIKLCLVLDGIVIADHPLILNRKDFDQLLILGAGR